MKLTKILVANRGEIALRIVRACRDLGIVSVAVYSDVDRLSQHVRYADEAYHIGPAEAAESYLNVARILEVARVSGADGIHPGYGFLAESAEFAEACTAAGLKFIGPSPASVRLLGDKAEARKVAERAGVTVVPGAREFESVEDARALAAGVGYPVMVKAIAGGGGRGIRLVEDEDGLSAAIAQARQESEAAFNDGRLYLEKLLRPVRHIEIQIIADEHGNIVPLGERECSIQRRHQKVIEECPSIAVGPELRRALNRASKAIAREANYTNVGTVEFLVTPEDEYFFLEMNTRLQVEHPVTEITTGVDLVKDQINVAGGEQLPYDEGELLTRGWAIECRIVAEDPFNNFLPAIGRILLAREPAGPGVRVESALYDGIEITPHYDSLLAKVTAWGRHREGAISRMKRALQEFRIVGVATNIPYLREVMELPAFNRGELDTEFLDMYPVVPREPLETQKRAAAIAALLYSLGPSGSGRAPAPNGLSGQPSRWRARMGGQFTKRAMGRWPRSI